MGRELLPFIVTLPPVLGLLFYQTLLVTCIWLLVRLYSLKLQLGNSARRKALLAELGYSVGDAERKRIIGFFHPYW
jgi:hypothetical protein